MLKLEMLSIFVFCSLCPSHLPLLDTGSRFALVAINWVQHDFVRIIWIVGCVSFAPVITDSVCEDRTVLVESACRDSATDCWISLESVFCYPIPEVECSVGASCTKCAVLWVEGNCVDRIDVRHVILWGISVAFEGEVQT